MHGNIKTSIPTGREKINRFAYKIKKSLIVPKRELAYNSKRSNKAQKLPTYSDLSVDRSEKQKCLKTLICMECIGGNATWVQFHVTLQFSISFIQPVVTLIRNV